MHPTREAWLEAAVAAMRPWFEGLEAQPPTPIRISTGWSRGAKKNQVGWCWASEVAGDASSNIFISPEREEPVKILATVLHEMCHAADDCKSGHGGLYRRLWKAVGFVEKPTHSIPSPELGLRLVALAEELGAYPHSSLSPSTKTKTQKTYMIKLVCQGCGMVVRCTRKWLDEVGPPSCACSAGPMTEDEG